MRRSLLHYSQSDVEGVHMYYYMYINCTAVTTKTDFLCEKKSSGLTNEREEVGEHISFNLEIHGTITGKRRGEVDL